MIRLLLCFAFVVAFANARGAELPVVAHYSLEVKFLLRQQRMDVRAEMRVTNGTAQPVSEVPFLLYRLLEAKSAEDDTAARLDFAQTVVRDADSPQLQVNLVKVALKEPLKPGATATIVLRYDGFIHGYPELMPYVRESISEQYALLRLETFSYPILALPNQASRWEAYRTLFTYDLRVAVPQGYSVATGGQLTETASAGDDAVFVYRSKIPIGQIDIAVARFVTRKDSAANLTVYALPGHEAGADRVLDGVKRVVAFYSRHFGPIGADRGYTVIELPAGWGSQAPPLYILQTAPVFERPERMVELYHEVGHTWNAKPKPQVQRTRYFDEAFASYFAALAVRELEGQAAFEATLEEARRAFLRGDRVGADPRNLATPIADYGRLEIGGLSYSKGAWSLYVLHRLLGDEAFDQVMRTFLAAHAERGADFEDFRRTAEQVSGRDLGRFFAEWIYGTESSRLLAANRPIEQIVLRYR